MPDAPDIPILLRRFEGVNRQLDSVYLGPSILRRASNWVPDRSLVLRKRNGTVDHLSIAGAARIDLIGRFYSPDELTSYLYAVVTPTGGAPDELWVSVDDAAFSAVTGGAFAESGATYDFAVLGTQLYVGNGIDPIKRLTLGSTAADLDALDSFTDGSAGPTLSADTGAALLSGTYSYGWAVLNHATGVWITRGQARTISKATAAEQSISFPVATGYTLQADERFHLFVAPVNLPIELGTDQAPEGITSGSIVLRDIQVVGATPWPLRGVARSGNKFAIHRSALWFTGMDTDRTAVFATSVIFPYEQGGTFDQAEFFPLNAQLRLSGTVTGIAVAASGDQADTPQAPIALFTRTQTFLFFGDILNDPSATLTPVSTQVGCSSHWAIVATPYGLIWPGLESVYQMPPGGGPPLDIGWPIGPDIRAIPADRRDAMRATYHKGFYKLAFSSPGSGVNDQAWWLDLRNGNVGAAPRWFGPHTTPSPASYTVGLLDTDELDRGFVAVEGTGDIVLDDQESSRRDLGEPILAVLETGELDDGRPFDAKIWSKVRVTAKADQATALAAFLNTAEGVTKQLNDLPISGPVGDAVWDTAVWNDDVWVVGPTSYSETQTTSPASRPVGLAARLILTHAAAVDVSLRDVEVRYHPVERAWRSPDTPPRA